MSEDKKPFTVNDRRHFTPSGEARDTSVEEAPLTQPDPDQGERPQETAPPTAATLTGLLLGLTAQAANMLQPSNTDDGPADEHSARLAEARHIISILEMLRDKTEGRRSPEEEQVLEGVLYELKMAYLHSTTGTGRA
jgi:hypothetical protein